MISYRGFNLSRKVGEEMTTTSDQVKVYKDGLDKLMGQLNQAITQLEETQKAVGAEMDNFANTLKESSKNAFAYKSNAIKTVFYGLKEILKDARDTGITAKETLQEVDGQIAKGIDVDINWM
ncbi:MAG: hypothetical protein FWG43_02315 [Clostridiales bacterium]|jgi:uncharacterized phage infection (PIP) family protein YhgE|nr:hypothetical protein [Clostridiales bacterium]